MNIELTQDDPRRGTFAPDGSISKLPDTDVFGQAYRWEAASTLWVNETTFVIIPPGKAQLIDTVSVANSAPVRSVLQERKPGLTETKKGEADANNA